jgi:hypothetical protein
MNATSHQVFISGGTGYMGRTLAAELLGLGHSVQILEPPQIKRGFGEPAVLSRRAASA